MKKKILLLMGVFAFGLLQAQVGINTDNPQVLFHIDAASTPAATNPSTGVVTAAQALDDLVINNNGNVGIGTINPATKLHIHTGGTEANPIPAFRMSDGSQGFGKYLTSDANGVAYWNSAMDNRLFWTNPAGDNGIRRFEITRTGIYLIVAYIGLQPADQTIPFSNVWANPLRTHGARPMSGMGFHISSTTRSAYMLANATAIPDEGVTCSGALLLQSGDVVTIRSLDWYSTRTPASTPILGVDILLR